MNVSALPDHPREDRLTAPALQGSLPRLIHGFLTARNGGDSPDGVWERLRDEFGGQVPRPMQLEQPHGTRVLGPNKAEPPKNGAVIPGGFDGAIGNATQPAVIAIRTADCVPILAVDPETGHYGALHAGWRGTSAGILHNFLSTLRQQGSTLRQLRLAFGPAIGSCCFEVRSDCTATFNPDDLDGAVTYRNGATYLDLHRVLTTQAILAGVPEERIHHVEQCTSCYTTGAGGAPFASYRRSRRLNAGLKHRNYSFIGILDGDKP